MRSFSLLVLLVAMLIAAYTMIKQVKGTVKSQPAATQPGDLKNQLDETVIQYQKTLQKQTQESGSQQ